MTWFKVDDSFYDHPKVFDAPDCAVALWTRAGAWSARSLTDGFVPAKLPARLCDDADAAVRELVDRGLWRRTKGGYQFHDWDQYQPSKEEVLAARAKKSSGGRIGNHRRWHVDRGVTDPGCPYCRDNPPSDNRSESDRSTEGGTESLANRPSRPVPSRPASDGGTRAGEGEGSQSVRMRARVREAVRRLRTDYGLTDQEAVAAWETAEARAKDPIRDPIPYLAKMAERGHLADIVEAIQLERPEPEPEAEPPPEAPQLRAVPGGAASSADPAATQPSMLLHALPGEDTDEPEPTAEPTEDAPRDIDLPAPVVAAALEQLTMSGWPYMTAAARYFARHGIDATEAQINTYALQLAWGSEKDRAALRDQPGVAAALERTG